ncbi:MAG: NPCBM/NEW2 domain-containing protein [Planctomycetaceae bacterium]
MPWATLLLTGLLAAGPAVEVQRLDGSRNAGQLVTLSADVVQVTDAAGETSSIDTSELRLLNFPEVTPPDQFADPPAIEVWLTDGSRLACTAIVSQQSQFTLTAEVIGELSVPRSALRAVRLAPLDRLDRAWSELHSRENQADLVVVRRQDALDFVEATVGDFGSADITVLVKDQTRQLPRDRTFGIIFAQPQASTPAAPIQLHFGRNSLQVTSVAIAEKNIHVSLSSQVHWQLPIESLWQVNFSGRMRLLTDLEEVLELPSGAGADERNFYFRHGTASNGAHLKIGANEVSMSEGLWVHSGTAVRYRINRDFRRLAGLVGMDHNVGGNRSVRLRILGDGRPLFDEVIRYRDRAQELDLDIAGVRDLELRVERLPENVQTNIFGTEEHLDLGNIRLIR